MPFRIEENDFPAGRSDSLSLSDTVRSLIYLYKKLAGANSWRDEPTNNVKDLTAQTEADYLNLNDFTESLYQRIIALEGLVYPKVLWRDSEFVINPQPTLTAIASFTVPAGLVDSRDRILILDVAFGAGTITGTRTIQITCGGIVIWQGTLAANAYTPVRKVISFDILLSRPRSSASGNAGYANTTTAGVFNFANFNLDVTFEVRASASSTAMTVNIEHLILSMT